MKGQTEVERITVTQIRGRVNDMRNDAAYQEKSDAATAHAMRLDAQFLEQLADQMEADAAGVTVLEGAVDMWFDDDPYITVGDSELLPLLLDYRRTGKRICVAVKVLPEDTP